MTEASIGLRKALARKSGVSQLTPEELLAQMTDEQRTALAASFNPAASAAEPAKKCSDDEDEDDMETQDGGEKKPMSKKKDEHMDDKAIAEAKAEERARFTTVMASDEYKGREDLAATLLASDLSADTIITALAAAPKAAAPAAPANAEADDDAARADMRQNLAAEQPEPTGQASEEEPQADNSLVANMKARFGL